jgi:hypothetical protein
MRNPTTALIELHRYYKNIITQSEYQAAQAKEQLVHIDALLVNGLLQGETQTLTAVIAPDEPVLFASLSSAPEPENRTAEELAEDVEDFLARSKPSRKAKITPEQPIPPGNRVPRPLLPAYQGLKRLEAITQVLQDNPDREMTTDSVILALFGNLSSEDCKVEKKRLKTLLYQGGKQKLWQKGRTPSSYIAGKSQTSEKTPSVPVAAAKASTAQAKALAAKPKTADLSDGRDSISLLPAYAGMNKLEAIAQVLTEQSGHVLHQDTIFQLLYGEVSPERISEESKRMRASLFQGATKGLWEKASNRPSSYLVEVRNGRRPKSTSEKTADAIAVPITKAPGKSGRKPSGSTGAKADSRGDLSALPQTASRGRTQVLSLPARYAGLSKIETVAKVLQENNGTTMHMDEIIEQLYGKLSGDDLKAEKVRMKDVMTRGVQRKLWNKAQGVPSSIVAGEPKQPSATRVKASTAGKVTKLEPAKSKKPRKAASAKPKRKKAEVIALLKKANIKV